MITQALPPHPDMMPRQQAHATSAGSSHVATSDPGSLAVLLGLVGIRVTNHALHDVAVVAIALGSSSPLPSTNRSLASVARTADNIPTSAHPVGGHTARSTLRVVLHVLLVPTLARRGARTSFILITCLVRLEVRVVDELVRELHQPLVSGDGPDRSAVCLHGIGLAHPQQREKHTTSPGAGLDGHLQTVLPEAIAVEQINPVKVATVGVMHYWLADLVLRSLEATVCPLTSVPGHLLCIKTGPAAANQEQGDLVHEGPGVKRCLANFQVDFHLHERLGEALAPHFVDQVLLGEAAVTSLDCKDGMEAMLIHQPLGSLARTKKTVGNHNTTTACPRLRQAKRDCCRLPNLVAVCLLRVPDLAFSKLGIDHHTRLTAAARLQLDAVLCGLAWLVYHKYLATTPPENHRLVTAQIIPRVPLVLPTPHASLQQYLEGIVHSGATI